MKQIFLSQGKLASVDDQDYEYLRGLCSWSFGAPYAQGRIKGKTRRMHKVVAERMGLFGEIDHEDRNQLNNQRYNLRLVTHTQNLLNNRLARNNTSGHKGIRIFHRKCGTRYYASIQVDGHVWPLGTYNSLEEALAARKRAEDREKLR